MEFLVEIAWDFTKIIQSFDVELNCILNKFYVFFASERWGVVRKILNKYLINFIEFRTRFAQNFIKILGDSRVVSCVRF